MLTSVLAALLLSWNLPHAAMATPLTPSVNTAAATVAEVPAAVLAAASADDAVYAHRAPKSPDPALPNVLLLGDSISIGYEPFVTEALKGKANVYRIMGTEDMTVRPKNGLRLSTDSALQHLEGWLGDVKFKVIHFNWGLHDVKLPGEGKGLHQVELEDYKKNLEALVQRLQKTGATLIWASTTPVPAGADKGPTGRKAGDEVPYNAAAKVIIEKAGIPIDDLHALVAGRLHEVQRSANVHFTDAGSKVLGTQVASVIEKALAAKSATP